ncbi:MarR family transcriptional regulator [Salinicoccus albus]|uniref:MarR family transcriptional regulator n=1 Tax=Salinicoccus albus TaxID=418756 RepID=UPI00037B9907|nr:MarR family transcriptional regulator [Salinicoccus albus]
MKEQSDVIKNLMTIYGYGYTDIFSDVTESVSRLHISKTQLDIIQFIYLNGSATPSQLAGQLNVQRSAITHTVKKLQHKNLITVRQNGLTNDRRSKLIYMTEEAEQFLREFMTSIHKKIEMDIKSLSEEELKELYKATVIIMKYLPGGSNDETYFEI